MFYMEPFFAGILVAGYELCYTLMLGNRVDANVLFVLDSRQGRCFLR